MTESYWNTESDPYQYPGSSVLMNIPDIHDASALELFEQRTTMLRVDEAIAAIAGVPINLDTWQMIHRIIFRDVYAWAGEIRTVQLVKDHTVFAMPEHIPTEAKRLFEALACEDISSLERTSFIERIAYSLVN